MRLLKKDPLFALLSGAKDLEWSSSEKERGTWGTLFLAGKSTLNRLELSLQNLGT